MRIFKQVQTLSQQQQLLEKRTFSLPQRSSDKDIHPCYTAINRNMKNTSPIRVCKRKTGRSTRSRNHCCVQGLEYYERKNDCASTGKHNRENTGKPCCGTRTIIFFNHCL